MDDLLIQMGERILARRKQMYLTQEELAEKSGITSQTISNAELGKKALRPENIIRVCEALDVSSDYLLLGNIAQEDQNILIEKLSRLSTEQYRHLESIIDNFVAAVNEKDKFK